MNITLTLEDAGLIDLALLERVEALRSERRNATNRDIMAVIERQLEAANRMYSSFREEHEAAIRAKQAAARAPAPTHRRPPADAVEVECALGKLFRKGSRRPAYYDDAARIHAQSRDNANDTVYVERAADWPEWRRIYVGSIQSLLSERGVNRSVTQFYARLGIRA